MIILFGILFALICINLIINICRKSDNIIESFIINVIAGIIIMTSIKILLKYFPWFTICIAYIVNSCFVGITKRIITYFANKSDTTVRSNEYKNSKKFILLDLISPDLFFTSLNKKIYKHQTKRIIKDYNFINVMIQMFLILISFLLMLFVKEKGYLSLILTIIYIRFISRSIEIVYSFVKDVIDNEQKSGLELQDRIKLCFLSVFEVFIAIININVLLDCVISNSNCNIVKYVINALRGIINNIDLNSHFIYTFSQVTYEITLFSLLGTVLGSYISNKKNK